MTLAQWMETHPELFGEWDSSANVDISPEQVTFGSKKKAWWRCNEGHTWYAAIYSRTSGESKCPYCSGKRVIVGRNDLASINKEALELWDTEKNGALLPEKISGYSHRLVWWRCENGHSWQARVDSVTFMKSGCPYCDGKKVATGENDLATVKPQTALEWCGELNDLSPEEITSGSKKKAWWQCELGHRWQASVQTRGGKINANCPYCAGRRVLEGFNDLATTHPQLASEWCYEHNNGVLPTQVMKGAHRKVFWKCGEGHVWEAYIFARSKENGTGCPVCAGRVKPAPYA